MPYYNWLKSIMCTCLYRLNSVGAYVIGNMLSIQPSLCGFKQMSQLFSCINSQWHVQRFVWVLQQNYYCITGSIKSLKKKFAYLHQRIRHTEVWLCSPNPDDKSKIYYRFTSEPFEWTEMIFGICVYPEGGIL